jgi:hypothetical protein
VFADRDVDLRDGREAGVPHGLGVGTSAAYR